MTPRRKREFAFDLQVEVPEGSAAWKELLPEIPQGAELLEAFIVITHKRQYVQISFRGRRPDGEVHQRNSSQRVSLSPGQTEVLIHKAYPRNERANYAASIAVSR